MVVDIHKLIAAIRPELYADPEVCNKIKEIVKKEGYRAAANSKEMKVFKSDLNYNYDDAKKMHLIYGD